MDKASKIGLSIMVGLASSILLNYGNHHHRYSNVDIEKIMKTPAGIPVIAELGIDKTIDVVIDENFTTNQKQKIAEAIQELDVDLTGVDYHIILDNEKPDRKCVNIYKNDTQEFGATLGRTKILTNMLFGKVVWPVDITLYTERYVDFFDDPTYTGEVFSGIIKTEMLHVLWFDDVYDVDCKDKTIMYGNFNTQSQLTDLSQQDKDMVNSVYKPSKKMSNANQSVTTKIGKPFYVCQQKKKDEDLSM